MVLMILGLLAALVLPRLGRAMPGSVWRSQSYRLVNMLRQARYHAAVSGASCAVVVEPIRGGWLASGWSVDEQNRPHERLTQQWANETLFAAGTVPASKDQSASVHDDPRGAQIVVFAAKGVDTDYQIKLADGQGHSLTIDVQKPAGLVRLSDEPASSEHDDVQLSKMEASWRECCQSLP
jgi:Tfp pilus assembly protein FimT